MQSTHTTVNMVNMVNMVNNTLPWSSQGDVPQWVRNAMEVADISLEGVAVPLNTDP